MAPCARENAFGSIMVYPNQGFLGILPQISLFRGVSTGVPWCDQERQEPWEPVQNAA